MDESSSTDREAVSAVRRFSRFYTRRLGLLNRKLLSSEFPLTEVRVLYELAHRHGLTATDLVIELDLDSTVILDSSLCLGRVLDPIGLKEELFGLVKPTLEVDPLSRSNDNTRSRNGSTVEVDLG